MLDERDAEALAEALYREHGWSGCAGSAWSNLPDGAKDGWRFAARVRAETRRETLAEVERRLMDEAATWGVNTRAYAAVRVSARIVRDMADAGEPDA